MREESSFRTAPTTTNNHFKESTMLNRTHLLSLAAFTVLVAVSGIARADDESSNVAAQPQTCEEAVKAAWFARQLELTDGPVSPEASAPAECQAPDESK